MRRSTAVATFEASEVAVGKVSILAAANVSVCHNNSRLCNVSWAQFPQACPLLAAVQILDLVESHQAGFEVAATFALELTHATSTSGAILTIFRPCFLERERHVTCEVRQESPQAMQTSLKVYDGYSSTCLPWAATRPIPSVGAHR